MSNRPSFPSINIGDAPPPLVCGPLTRTTAMAAGSRPDESAKIVERSVVAICGIL